MNLNKESVSSKRYSTKVEWVGNRIFATSYYVRIGLIDYIEMFYDPTYHPSNIGGVSSEML